MALQLARAFGTWPSILGAEVLAQSNIRLGSLSMVQAADGRAILYWVEVRPGNQGNGTLVRSDEVGRTETQLVRSDEVGAGPIVTDVTGPQLSVRTRVHEYGGRAYVVTQDEQIFFVNDLDQCLYQIKHGHTRRLTEPSTTRFAEPTVDPTGRWLVAVGERHPDTAGVSVENSLVGVEVTSGQVVLRHQGHNFYASPTLSKDGTKIAFLAWDFPHMPWDAAALYIADVLPDGSFGPTKHVAGGANCPALAPMWCDDGALYFSLELGDTFQPYRYHVDQDRFEPIGHVDGELGGPLWQLGTGFFGFSGSSASPEQSNRSLVGTVMADGVSHIVSIDTQSGVSAPIAVFPYVGEIAVSGRRAALLLGWSGQGSAIVLLDLDTGVTQPIKDVYEGLLPAEDTSIAEALTFPTGPEREEARPVAHGFFYAPKNGSYEGLADTKPPLVVLVHGGPTAAASCNFSPRIQFWTNRGFAVLDVNYRGSTGYGRAYRESLRGQWGILDVEDCVAGATYLATTGRVDADKMVIRGGSAGGYTVLQALCNHDVFRAGACLYGISDLEALTRDTHKFESKYDRFLVGPYPERRDLFIERSPIHYPERIKAPVVFFQGLEDKAVPPNQTEAMYNSLKVRGIETEYHAYEGEQHGFRKAETLRHVQQTELDFYQRILRLTQ